MRPIASIAASSIPALALAFPAAARAVPPAPFVTDSVGGTFQELVGAAPLPDGRVLAWERTGVVWLIRADGTRQPEPVLETKLARLACPAVELLHAPGEVGQARALGVGDLGDGRRECLGGLGRERQRLAPTPAQAVRGRVPGDPERPGQERPQGVVGPVRLEDRHRHVLQHVVAVGTVGHQRMHECGHRGLRAGPVGKGLACEGVHHLHFGEQRPGVTGIPEGFAA